MMLDVDNFQQENKCSFFRTDIYVWGLWEWNNMCVWSVDTMEKKKIQCVFHASVQGDINEIFSKRLPATDDNVECRMPALINCF